MGRSQVSVFVDVIISDGNRWRSRTGHAVTTGKTYVSLISHRLTTIAITNVSTSRDEPNKTLVLAVS